MKYKTLLLSLLFPVACSSETPRKTASQSSDEMLAIPIRTDDPLSAAEQKQIQAYTKDDSVKNERVFLAGVSKIPKTPGVYFRGHSEGDYHVGETITLDRFWSISSDRRIAESFTDPHGALLEIHAISARSIERYSVTDFEKEFILLPGTKLHVDAVSRAKLKFSGASEATTVPLVQCTEVGF